MYFVRLRGKVMGPFGDAQLVSLRDRGQLKSFHEVSTDRVLWVPASTLTTIFPPKVVESSYAEPAASSQGHSNNPGPGNEAWYWADTEGNRHGPFDLSGFKSLIDSGLVKNSTMVWKAGMADWIEARQALPSIFGPKPSGIRSKKDQKKQEQLLEDLKKTRLGILLLLIGGLVNLLCFPLGPVAFVLSVIGLGFCMAAPAPAKGPASLTFYFCLGTGLMWIVWFVLSLFGFNLLLEFVDVIGGGIGGGRDGAFAAEAQAASLTFLGFLSLTFMLAFGMLFTCGGFVQHTLRKLALVTGEGAIIKLTNVNFIIYCVLSGLVVSFIYIIIVIPLFAINGLILFSPIIMPKVMLTIAILESLFCLCFGVCYIITLIIIMQLYGKFGKMTETEED